MENKMAFTNKTLEYYKTNAKEFILSTQNVRMTDIQDEFLSFVKKGGHILDLGCGSGRDSKYFLENGFSVTAYDAVKEFCEETGRLCESFQSAQIEHCSPSENSAVPELNAQRYTQTGIRKPQQFSVEQKTFSDLVCQNGYDAVWACASLLHVPKSELPQIIEKIKNALTPEGIFYCSFKEGVFEGERNGRYFSDFLQDELCYLLKKSGSFELLKFWKTEDARPDRSEVWLNSLLKKLM